MNNAKNTTLFPYLERLLEGEEVEWKTLGEVCLVQRGASPRPIAHYLTSSSDGIPWIKIGDTKVGSKYIESTQERITIEGAQRSRQLSAGDFVLSNSMSYGRPYILKIDGAIHDGWASLSEISSSILSDYLFYFLSSSKVQMYWEGKINSGSVSNLNADIIKALPIPIPPLRVQARIVEILDKFTQLEAELEAELEARKKQYAYYRDQLLNFSQYPPLNVNIEWRTLGEVCHIVGRIGFRGYTRNDLVERGEGAISISPTNIVNQNLNLSAEKNTYISWEKYNESPEIMIRIGDIVLAKTASVGKAALVRELKEKATINPQMVVLKEISCLPAYLVYYICTPNFQLRLKSLSGQGSVPNISQAKLKTIPIPIPPLSEQRRIVDILDRFDTLTNSISEGLPKEIALRRKQYEYYRDALLNFPRAEATA